MSQTFYIAVDGQKKGPFTLDDLKSQNIQKDALIWTEGLDNWTKAEHIPLLKEVILATPPPLPNTEKTTQQVPPPPPNTAPTGQYFGYELARRRERGFAALVESIIIAIPLLLIFGESFLKADPYSLGSIVGWTIFSAMLGAIFYPIWSGNLGHKIMGLKVISAVDGTDLNKPMEGALREGLKSIFCYVIIPVIWLLWDDDRQNLYDKVVKTYVVKKK